MMINVIWKDNPSAIISRQINFDRVLPILKLPRMYIEQGIITLQLVAEGGKYDIKSNHCYNNVCNAYPLYKEI